MVYIFWSAASRKEAERILKMLLERHLVVCGSIFPEVVSIYRWQGEVAQSNEIKVLLKTTQDHFALVEKTIRTACSYDVPEITMLAVDAVSQDYLAWLKSGLRT